jgi:hypothetical protein
MMRVRARTLVVCLGGVAGALLVAGQLVSACVFDFAGPGDCADTRTCKGAPTTSSSSGSSSSSGTAGAGGSSCKSAAECHGPGPDGGVLDGGVCLAIATCKGGKCSLDYSPGDATDQPYGTCMRRVCDADGGITTIADDTNTWDAGNPCIVGACVDGGPTYTVPEGGTCPVPTGTNSVEGTCVAGFDGLFGACVQCIPGMALTDCAVGYNNCSQNYCVPVHCTDLVMDDGETGVDCGGGECAPCPGGSGCLHSSDCQSNNCIAATTCMTASCTDNVQNHGESDVDCGGPCPNKCKANLGCFFPSDCVDQVCVGGKCQAPTCMDGVQNGDETGVDCGGVTSACPPCPLE